MAVRKIIKMGDPALTHKAVEVMDFNEQQLANDITDMIDTMRHYHGVGLAAPQIGLSKQILVLEVKHNHRYPEAKPIELEVLLNPKIIEFSKATDIDWEACLSLPGLRGRVPRASHISYQAYNRAGELVTGQVRGFHARIIQHELDHLNGVLYHQRLANLHDFGFEDSLPDFQQD